MKEPLTGNIDFLLTIDTTNGQHTFNATLKSIDGEFRIYLYPDETISFNELVRQSSFWNDEIPYFRSWPSVVYKYSCYIDFLHAPNYHSYQDLSLNKFTNWSWDLVKLIGGNQTKELLQNDGFFAQMGINNISETLNHLQDIVGSSYEITEEMKNEVRARLEQKGIALYSYLPISKEFIFQHQNELDWKVMQKNPRIQWDWELINLYLRKVKEMVSEDKWPQYLLGSKAMYEFVGNYLNDEILSDIEKLYNIV